MLLRSRPLHRHILVSDRDLGASHVGSQEGSQTIGASTRQAIKWISHWLAIGVPPVTDTTIRSRVVASSRQFLVNAVVIVIGDHDKQLTAQSLRESLGDQHVLESRRREGLDFRNTLLTHKKDTERLIYDDKTKTNLWPTATAEIVGTLGSRSRSSSVLVQVTERAIEGNGHR